MFEKLKGPVFLKESSSAKIQLEQLKEILDKMPDDIKPKVEKDINLLSYGIFGEDNIAFELKNSHIPMYVLHDLYIEDEGLSAQIDYLIITQKRNFIIECKNLIGDIEIKNNGDFVRTFKVKGYTIKEGIYSPITQNKRHLELIKQIRLKKHTNIITKTIFNKYFYDNYRSIVVLSNPKTVLNMKGVSKDIKDQVIRADQIVNYITKFNIDNKTESLSQKNMEDLANFYLGIHKNNHVDYIKKYTDKIKESIIVEETPIMNNSEEASDNSIEISGADLDKDTKKAELIKELKFFRLNKSKEENMKPYMIFSDKHMEDLIIIRPLNVEELRKVSGFGDVKCSKYGEDIVALINKYM
ncbi:MAG: NERD domain-containing protein [Proteocatella sp.]